jgi:pyruvate,orthophosphate dikinase
LLTGDVENEHMTKWVYTFGDGHAEGSAADRNLLGGKGANLAEMCNLGLPVPPGLTITTDACVWYYDNGRKMPDGLESAVADALVNVGKIAGRAFGDPEKPLLLSVRSGARASMPGMMDTVLNLGLNDETVLAVARDSGDERFAFDSYRRFIQMYADVVMGLDHEVFEEILEDEKARLGHELDTDVSADEWREIIARYMATIEEELGIPVPAGPAPAALGRDRRGVRQLDERPGHHLPATP